MIVLAGSIAVAQSTAPAQSGQTAQSTKVTTPEDLDKVMKKVGPALQATNKALAANNVAEASKQLAIIKQGIVDSREFWVVHKKDAALAANKETLAMLESVEKMLSTGSPDVQAVQAALKQEVGAACRQCHEKYRARDAENNWILKPGSIEGL